MDNGDEVVGHKTFSDGKGGFRHEPITQSEADVIWAACKAAEDKRAADMPDDAAALRVLMGAYQRLRELGWREAIYSPKDGTVFQVIEAGSTGIHEAHYSGEWPKGGWWIAEDGDLWPSRPILFRLYPEDEEKRQAKMEAASLRYAASVE